MSLRSFYLSAMLYCVPICVTIDAQSFAYVQYGETSDSPFKEAKTVAYDTLGYLWVGTPNGLYRFNGNEFESYSSMLKSHNIHRIKERLGSLYFVNDQGINEMDRLDDRPIVRSLVQGGLNQTDELPFYPNDLEIDLEGHIWISNSDHSVGRFSANGYQVYRFSPSDTEQHISILLDPKGQIWVLSPMDGLFFFNRSRKEFDEILEVKGDVIMFDEEFVLIGGDKLDLYSRVDHTLRFVKSIDIGPHVISAIHKSKDGYYFIGTQSGRLFVLDDLHGIPRRVYGANDPHRVEALKFGKIHHIFSPPGGTDSHKIWLCTENGLWMLHEHFFASISQLPFHHVSGVSVTDKSRAFVAMNHLYEITETPNGFVAKKIFDDHQINAVAKDKFGNLWVSTVAPRNALLKIRDGQIVKRYPVAERGSSIFNIEADSKGNIWFCQAPFEEPIIGIGKVDNKGQLQYYDASYGFSSRILVLKEGPHGEIYAAGIGDNYFYVYDSSQNRFVNLSPTLPFEAGPGFEVHDMTVDERGVVWLASTDGLLRYDSEKMVLIQNELLGQREVRGVTSLPDNKLWIATATDGLIYYQDKTFTSVDESAGLPSLINTYRSIVSDDLGRIWVGTTEGLVFSRNAHSTLPTSPKPRIQYININHDPLHQIPNKRFKMRQSDRADIRYTNLSFGREPTEYQFRTVLEEEYGILLEEQIWQPAAHQGIVVLENMEIGNYIVEVRAREPGGYQWSQPHKFDLHVFRPWFYQTWFLIPIIAGGILLLGYYLSFSLKRRINKMKEVLKYANTRLAEKQAQLDQKINEFDEKEVELANARSNIQTLELFIQEMDTNTSWNEIITVMGKAVDQSIDVDAFEICFTEKNSIFHKGYSNQESGGYTFRSKPFDPKTSLTSWAIANESEVKINDFDEEHSMYILPKQAYRFKSLIFVPFSLNDDRSAALCIYSTKKNQFDDNDLIMVRILARFIALNVNQEITQVL